MRVVVIGAGLAGLFTASELMSRGVDDLMIVDRSATPGGVARTIRKDGFALEPAAGSFNLPHPHLSPILKRAGVTVEPAAGPSTRYVHIGGRLIPVRPSPAMTWAPILPFSAKLRALLEVVVKSGAQTDDESLADFCRRRFGRRAGELLAWFMASGVFAGDPESLSVAAAFPTLAALESRHGSVIRGGLSARRTSDAPRPRMHLPAKGMDVLADQLARSLGGRFRGDFEVGSVRRLEDRWMVEGADSLEADAVVLAMRPAVAAQFLDDDLAAHLRHGPDPASVAVVGVGGRTPSPLPFGFGALIGPDEGMVSRGVLFESSYALSRAPDGWWLAKVILGGARRPEVDEWDDERLAATAVREVGEVVGGEVDAGFVEVVRHRPGIPQYDVGHRQWLEDLDDLLATTGRGLHLTGWGYRGVGVAHLATDAVRVADRITGAV